MPGLPQPVGDAFPRLYAMLKQLPLLFSFKEVVLGDGFLAGVRMDGRALLEEGIGGAWITGVSPAGVADGGADRAVAFQQFRTAWAEILFEIAADSSCFAEFKANADEFLGATVPALTEEWEAALVEVRRSKFKDSSLRTESAQSKPVRWEVVELTAHDDGSKKNEAEGGLRAAA